MSIHNKNHYSHPSLLPASYHCYPSSLPHALHVPNPSSMKDNYGHDCFAFGSNLWRILQIRTIETAKLGRHLFLCESFNFVMWGSLLLYKSCLHGPHSFNWETYLYMSSLQYMVNGFTVFVHHYLRSVSYFVANCNPRGSIF